MLLDKLKIIKFRKFENNEIHFGKYLTCISGYNAVGKSTILGLLANSFDFTKKDGVTFDGHAFKVELRDIIKFSPEHDVTIPEVYSICFEGAPDTLEFPKTLSFRATWQEDNTRYRLIPKKSSERNTERKIKWPILYLGLSRLYPVGEVTDEEITEKRIPDSHWNEIKSTHQNILSSSENYTDSTTIDIHNTKKYGFGIKTDTYGPLSNSAGQDNLGQILKAVYSMKLLKESLGEDWNGGILLIDEIDATLHPAAQNKLIDFLFQFTRTNNFQVVFTTHSLSLLEYLNSKYIEETWLNRSAQSTSNISVELIYIANSYGNIEPYRNPDINAIKNDLSNSFQNTTSKPIMVYSEDEEARWFFEKLLNKYNEEQLIRHAPVTFTHINVSLGKNQLLTLLSGDYKYFSKNIVLLDGDVPDAEINNQIRTRTPLRYNSNEINNKVIIKLPGNKSVEELLWIYSTYISEDHDFYRYSGDFDFNKRIFIENGPDSQQYSDFGTTREKNKEWFKANLYYMEHLFDFWYRDHRAEAIHFLKSLKSVTTFAMKNNAYSGQFLIDNEKLHHLIQGG